MKRPQISDEELYQHVLELHKIATGNESKNFEAALETVTSLAEQQVEDSEEIDPHWYPGKYLGKAVNRVIGSNSSSSKASRSSGVKTIDTTPYLTNPQKQAVFKTRLSEDNELPVPDEEVAAFDLEPGTLMQVAAYPVETDGETQTGESSD